MLGSKREKSFTLIELLVVIAIIGILSGIILSALGRAKAAARDAARKIVIVQIQTAIEAYIAFNDKLPYGVGLNPPCDTSIGMSGGACTGAGGCRIICSGNNWDSNSPFYLALLNQGFITGPLPVDPVNKGDPSGATYGHYYYYEEWSPGASMCWGTQTCPATSRGCYEISAIRLESKDDALPDNEKRFLRCGVLQ